MNEEKQNTKNIKKEENKAITPAKEPQKSLSVKKFFRRKYHHRRQNHNQEQKLAHDFTKMLSASVKIMIPWLLIPSIIFSVGAYFIFDVVVFSYYTPLWFKIIFGIINFGFFLILGLIYGLGMGLIASLKVFSQNFGLIIRQSINSLKNSLENRINNVSFSMFSKKELSNIITQTFNDFSYNIRKYAQKTALGVVAIGILSSVLFFARHFIVRSIGIIKSKADAFALISARTSLIVAVVLNLTLFTKIALWLGTFLGLGIVLLQTVLVLYLK